MGLQYLSRVQLDRLIALADMLYPPREESAVIKEKKGRPTLEQMKEDGQKELQLQAEIERLSPAAIQELSILMLVGRDDGSVLPDEYWDAVKAGNELGVEYLAGKSDLAKYLRNGLRLMGWHH